MSKDTCVLVVEDEDMARRQMCRLLDGEGYDCVEAATAVGGIEQCRDVRPDVILLDLNLPDRPGTEVIDELLAGAPEALIFVITGEGDMEKAIESFRKGVSDFIQKPFHLEYVHNKIQNILDVRRTEEENRMLRRKLNQATGDETELVGESDQIQSIRESIQQVSGTGSTVLVTGESGTGKEVVARRIHELRSTEGGHFIGLNCAGIPGDLLESELFGHEKGAFTGANTQKKGYFETNEQDTVLLDEIGDMPLELQPKLLRALEERSFFRVGGDEKISLNAQMIATTNRDLRRRVDEGAFREDLYYRLSVFEITVPPLAEHKEDIPLLTDHFVQQFSNEQKKSCNGVTGAVLDTFHTHSWPGNVRELKNTIEHGMIVFDDQEENHLQTDHLPDRLRSDDTESVSPPDDTYPEDLEQAVRTFQKQHLRGILSDCDWNKKEAADVLGIDLSTLYRKIDRLEIQDSEQASD